MTIIFTLRILADLCFYFTFANFIGVTMSAPSALTALPILAVSTFVCASLRNKPDARFLPLAPLPLGLAMVLMSSTALFFVLLPPVLYIAYRVKRINKFTMAFSYERVMFLYLKLFLPFALAMALMQAWSFFETASLPFALMFLISAIALLRMLRQRPETLEEPRYKLRSLLSVAGVLGTGILIGSRQFLDALGALMLAVYLNVIAPLLTLVIGGIVFVFGDLMDRTRKLTGAPRRFEFEFGELPSWQPDEEYMTQLASFRGVVLATIGLIAVIAVIRFLRRLSWRPRNVIDAIGVGRYTPIETEVQPVRMKRPRGPARQLREYYRKFLLICEQNDITRKPHMTTADFERLSAARFQLPDEAAGLRALYISARYGENAVGCANVRHVGELYAAFKKASRTAKGG